MLRKMAAGRSTELKLFEALENYTNNESFCSKASFVQNFLDKDLDLNNTQQSLQIDNMSEIVDSEFNDSVDLGTSREDEDDYNSSLNTSRGGGPSNRRVRFLGGNGREELLKLLLQRHHKREKINREDGEGKEDAQSEVESIQGEYEHSVMESINEEDEEEEESEVEDVQERSGTQEEEDDNASYYSPEEKEEMQMPVIASDISGGPLEKNVVDNWSDYFKLMELKRSLDEKHAQLEKEKESFRKLKNLEEAQIKAERKRVESQRSGIQKIMTDYNKFKGSREEYEEKIKGLEGQLKETKLQMNKRISRCGDQQKKLEERVKALEKENEELKKRDQQQRSIPARLAALKRPPMRCLTNKKQKEGAAGPGPPKVPQPRRVQFATDVCGEKNEVEEEDESVLKENESLTSTKNSSASSTSTFFNESFFKSPEATTVSPKNSSSLLGAAADTQQEQEVHLSDDEADRTMPADYMEIRHACGTITRITKDNKLTR